MHSHWWSPQSPPKRRCRRQCGAWRISAAQKKGNAGPRCWRGGANDSASTGNPRANIL